MTPPESVRPQPASGRTAPGGGPPTLDDPRVTRQVEEYLSALEQGSSPDREELLRRYPEIADELAACLDVMEFIHQVGPQLEDRPADAADKGPPSAEIRPLAALGDFRIEREIGRGGMGVVYEATQLSLGRQMALKVLPFAAMLDPRQLKRFKNEARAAASLDHPNIVSVHSVGCQRGIHYYAMQYIEGQTLAEVIAGLRQKGEGGRGKGEGEKENEDPQSGPPPSAFPLPPSSSPPSAFRLRPRPSLWPSSPPKAPPATPSSSAR